MPLTKRGGWPYSNPPNTQFTLNTQSPQARGLVGWWPTLGQYGNVTTVRDYVANRYPMTQYNTPTWKDDGQFGNTILYDDASSERLEVAQAVISSYPLTLTAWTRSNDDTAAQAIVSIYDFDAVNVSHRIQLRGPAGGDPISAISQSGAAVGQADAAIGFTAGKWHFVAGVFSSATLRTVYVDGGHPGSDVTNVTPANLSHTGIGAWGSTSIYVNFMSGQIADARIYNRALTAAEIWQLYDPATRWELYKPVMPDMLGFAGGVTIPLFMHHYRQLRIGNGF